MGVFVLLNNEFSLPMNQELTLYKKSSRLNLNQSPRKAIIDNLINYSKSIQFVNASIGQFVVVNN
jgi:hypothetical protein